MPPTESLSDLESTAFDLTVHIDSTQFDTVAEAETAIVETAARSIVAHEDALDDDDAPYVTTQVTFDSDGVKLAINDADVGIAEVQTLTELALLDN